MLELTECFNVDPLIILTKTTSTQKLSEFSTESY